MNQAILIGNLTKDPERIQRTNGEPLAKFTIANNDDRENTLFMECVAFRKTAENVVRYLSKGSKVLVLGKIKESKWESDDGVKHNRTSILCDKVEFLSSKIEDSGEQADTKKTEPTPTEDDLPF